MKPDPLTGHFCLSFMFHVSSQFKADVKIQWDIDQLEQYACQRFAISFNVRPLYQDVWGNNRPPDKF